MASAGVGIVSLRSILAQRVRRIMDTSRSLSTRAGNLLLALVLVGGLVGTVVVGLVGLDSGPQGAQAAQADDSTSDESQADDKRSDESQADEKKTADAAAASDPAVADDELLISRGRVLDPAGKPVEGATVRVGSMSWRGGPEYKLVSEAKTDRDGRYEIRFRKSQIDVGDGWRRTIVSAFKAGLQPDWAWQIEPAGRGKDGPAELRLGGDDQPITGRLVDLEGRPLAGIHVELHSLSKPEQGDLTPWLDRLAGRSLQGNPDQHLSMPLPKEGIGLDQDVVTDAEGRFRLSGLGRERVAYLVFAGPTVVRTLARVVTRRMPPLVEPARNQDESREKDVVLGADFDLVLPPTRPVEGIVRDAATGQPLAGVTVRSLRPFSRHFDGASTQTDETGHYRLVGMPKGPRGEIIVAAGDEQPYLMRVFELGDTPGLEPIHIDVELHRGIWITGRVSDAETGAPVVGGPGALPPLPVEPIRPGTSRVCRRRICRGTRRFGPPQDGGRWQLSPGRLAGQGHRRHRGNRRRIRQGPGRRRDRRCRRPRRIPNLQESPAGQQGKFQRPERD